MSLLKNLRTKETYLDKIESLADGTQDHIKFSIQNFENFSMERFGKVNIIPDLKKAEEQEVFDILQLWINWTKELAPKTIRNRFYAINNFLHYMGIKLHEKDIKQELTFPSPIEEELYGVKIEEIQKIFGTMQYKKRTMFTCQTVGLMRIGELVQLRKKHVSDLGSCMRIKIPAGIAKFNKARTTFWSKEAAQLVRPILKRINDEDLIFQKNPKKQSAIIAAEEVLRRALVRVGLDMKYESTGRFMINTHSLRAYGITKVSRIDENFAKKIAGQKGYLLQYDRIDDDEKLEIYKKCESKLLIDDKKIKVAQVKELEQELETTNMAKRADNQDMLDIMTPEQLEELARKKRSRQVRNY